MSKTLTEIAQELKNANKKVQLIYAFNGTGKTRLSKEFKKLINGVDGDGEEIKPEKRKILYYNAYTEDLFYWDNDLENDGDPKLKIQPNTFTNWILKDQGQEEYIIKNFQNYTNDKLTPKFNEEYDSGKKDKDGKKIMIPAFSEITFSFQKGDETSTGNIKISKGEESNFIWSVFYSIFKQIIDVLNEPNEEGETIFDDLDYIFVDDPVSSLDENHLIELAVNLAKLIKSSTNEKLKFIITTHNPLFYNVLYSELELKNGWLIKKHENGTYDIDNKKGDSNCCFSYHLYLKQTLQKAIKDDSIEKYHFTLLRNLYEKIACFLGYPRWAELLPNNKDVYYKRIIQFTSHSTLSNETVAEPTPQEKKTIEFLLNHLIKNYSFWEQEEQNNEQ